MGIIKHMQSPVQVVFSNSYINKYDVENLDWVCIHSTVHGEHVYLPYCAIKHDIRFKDPFQWPNMQFKYNDWGEAYHVYELDNYWVHKIPSKFSDNGIYVLELVNTQDPNVVYPKTGIRMKRASLKMLNKEIKLKLEGVYVFASYSLEVLKDVESSRLLEIVQELIPTDDLEIYVQTKGGCLFSVPYRYVRFLDQLPF